MIRLSGTSLIIEIPTTNGEKALGMLHDYQSALIQIPAIIDFEKSNLEAVKWSLMWITRLLEHMVIDKDQLNDIHVCIDNSNSIDEIFK